MCIYIYIYIYTSQLNVIIIMCFSIVLISYYTSSLVVYTCYGISDVSAHPTSAGGVGWQCHPRLSKSLLDHPMKGLSKSLLDHPMKGLSKSLSDHPMKGLSKSLLDHPMKGLSKSLLDHPMKGLSKSLSEPLMGWSNKDFDSLHLSIPLEANIIITRFK